MEDESYNNDPDFVETTTSTTTTTAQPISIDIPVSSGTEQDTECENSEYKCVPSDQCQSYLSDSEKLRNLRKGTQDYNQLLGKLRGLACNKSKKKICCSPSGGSQTPKGECY